MQWLGSELQRVWRNSCSCCSCWSHLGVQILEGCTSTPYSSTSSTTSSSVSGAGASSSGNYQWTTANSLGYMCLVFIWWSPGLSNIFKYLTSLHVPSPPRKKKKKAVETHETLKAWPFLLVWRWATQRDSPSTQLTPWSSENPMVSKRNFLLGLGWPFFGGVLLLVWGRVSMMKPSLPTMHFQGSVLLLVPGRVSWLFKSCLLDSIIDNILVEWSGKHSRPMCPPHMKTTVPLVPFFSALDFCWFPSSPKGPNKITNSKKEQCKGM